MKKQVYERNYKVHHYEVDRFRRITIPSILNYFEDIVSDQTNSLGIGLDYLSENNKSWFVYKWKIHINKYAVDSETLKVRTWANSFRKFYGFKKYEILNSKGELLAYADSLWIFIDTKIRKPCKITDGMWTKFGLTLDDNEEVPFEKLHEPSNITEENEFKIRYSDIDSNNHVNNVKYVEWVLETIPHSILNSCDLNDLAIVYEKEAFNKEIKVKCETKKISNNQYVIFSCISNLNNERLALFKTTWTTRSNITSY